MGESRTGSRRRGSRGDDPPGTVNNNNNSSNNNNHRPLLREDKGSDRKGHHPTSQYYPPPQPPQDSAPEPGLEPLVLGSYPMEVCVGGLVAEKRAFECVQQSIQSVTQGPGLGPRSGQGPGLGQGSAQGPGLGPAPKMDGKLRSGLGSGSGSGPRSGFVSRFGLGEAERALVLLLSHKALVGGFCGTLGDCVLMQVMLLLPFFLYQYYPKYYTLPLYTTTAQ